MYLQSAEILNFHGIRHLKIDFDPATSALIGENAWGKSSLLSALWLILGQGSEQLCTFSKNDLYVPIRLGSDKSDETTPSPATDSADKRSIGAEQKSIAQHDKTGTDVEQSAKALLGSALQHLSSEQLLELKPYKVVNTKDCQRCYFAIPSPDNLSKILRIVDVPLDPEPSALSNATKKSKKQKTQGSKTQSTAPAPVAQTLSDSLSKALNTTDKESMFQALQDAQTVESVGQNFSSLSANHLMQRARRLLENSEGLNDWAKNYAQADFDFFANDIYQSSADKIMIDLIFCETNFGAINNIERFAKIKPACYYGDDGLYRIHYRITGQEAKLYVQNKSPATLLTEEQSGTVVYANTSCATSTQAYKQPDAPMDISTTYNESEPDTKFVTIHELIDANGKAIDNSLDIIKDIIKDLIKLNPLLRLRDRRMLKLSDMEEILQKNATSEGQSDELCNLNTLFVSISQEDDLTCEQLNQGLAELNVIASKYLVNYRANHYLQNPNQTKSRTAREIVSHPVSIETLNTLKQSLEDKRPSRSKFLLSLLAGAMLMNKGTQEIDPHSKPILVLEDIEGRFHPTLLLTLWSILDTIPVQKIVTTNSSALLSAMPMSNIRRLCRQYYDVRCYSMSEHSFSADDERRIAFHIRISRPSAFFARCWILVEGETEVWILNEIAGILGMNLACEGVKTIEFAQCGLSPLIKLAKQLGISYYVLTDGDDAGKKYAQTVQSFTGNQHLSEHLSVIPHLDIEHYLYVSGYADVYQKSAGLMIQAKKDKVSRKELSDLLKQAQGLMHDQVDAVAGSSPTPNKYALLASATKDKVSITGNSNFETTVELNPILVTVSLDQVLHSLQRWFGQKSAKLNRMRPHSSNQSLTKANSYLDFNDLALTEQEHASLQQVINLALEFLPSKESKNSNSNLNQNLQNLTFDISKVTVEDINQYYSHAELNLRRSGGLNRKLTNKQRQALQRLNQEKAEVLYGLKLTTQKPKTRFLFKSNSKSMRKQQLNQGGVKLTDNFTLPSSLYSYLKRNFMQRNSSKLHNLKQQVSGAQQFKGSFKLSSTLNKQDWLQLKSLISKLQSLQHKNPQGLSLTTTQRKAEAIDLLNHPAKHHKPYAAAHQAKTATDATITKSVANETTRDKTSHVSSSFESSSKSNLSQKQWVNKIAQVDASDSNVLQTDIELTNAQMDPRDEAKILRKARQQAGIKYGEYGAIDQSVLNKQGWTIDKIIDAAIHKKSKPGLAIEVIEAMQHRGKEAVPQMFRTMFMKIKRIAKSEFGL